MLTSTIAVKVDRGAGWSLTDPRARRSRSDRGVRHKCPRSLRLRFGIL